MGPYRSVEEHSIVVMGINGEVVGVDRHTGEIVWKNELPGGGHGIVCLALPAWGDLVLASADGGKIFCLEYRTGQLRWSAQTTYPGRATILVDADLILVAKYGYVDAFALDGTKRWTQKLTGLGLNPVTMGIPGNVQQADGGQP